jgi:hypothetical protein
LTASKIKVPFMIFERKLCSSGFIDNKSKLSL